MDASIAGLLRSAKERLAPGAWTQGTMARDRNGAPCEPTSPDAVAWCVLGVLVSLDRRRARDAHDFLARATPGRLPAPIYQDAPERTLGQVLELLERATVLAESEGASNG